MPNFFVNKENISDGIITITGEDAHHISRSLRMAKGDKITVCDGTGTEYLCYLTEFGDGYVIAKAEEKYVGQAEPEIEITLYQGYPKSDKLEYIIQKSVEIGAKKIVPFDSEFCVKRPNADKVERQIARLSKIAYEAAKQCGASVLPEVSLPMSFPSALEDAKENSDLFLFCYEGKGTLPIAKILKENKDVKKIAVFIGCEGGFSDREFSLAKEMGAIPVGLGNRILRCETAPIFALSCIIYEYQMS